MAKLAHVITGPDGSFESWSETLPQLIGVRPPTTTRAWLELLHPEDRALFRAKAIEAASTGDHRELEYRLRRADGEWIRLRQTMEPLSGDADEQGPMRWFSTLQDVTEQRRAEAKLRASEALKGAIFESSLDSLITIDLDGNIVEFNPAAEATFGFTRAEVLGKPMAELIIPQRFRQAHHRGFAHHLATGEASIFGKRLELDALRADGSEFPVELTVVPIHAGSAPMFTGFLRDITQRRAAEARIRRLNRVYAVLSGINSLIVRARERDELFREACRVAVQAGEFPLAWIGLVDEPARRLQPVAWQGADEEYVAAMPLGLDAGEARTYGLAGRSVSERTPMIANDMVNDPRITLRAQADQRGFRAFVALPLVVADKAIGVLTLYAREVGFFDDAEMKLLNELAGDISFAVANIAQADRLAYLSNYDPLTGLANRSLLHERLTQHISVALRERQRLALCIVDVERFKSINDTLGRQIGDALLRQIGARLVTASGDAGLVARVGSDHFALLLPRVSGDDQLISSLDGGRARLEREPYDLGGTELRLATKAGVAVFPSDGGDAETLFRNAEAALKKAKAQGERYLFYTEAMTERIHEKLALENKLRLALEKDEFILHYQPKVALEDRRILGVEALIRWQSPELGLVPPMKFIPLLEETGLILEVGSWALRRASLDHRRWAEQGLTPPRVAVNVSAIQLRQRDFVRIVEEAIMEGLAPTAIDLEITESLLMEDIEASMAKLGSLRALGVRIAIDDFGTGYSSLGYLAKLPAQSVKIDRSFIKTMLSDASAMTIVSTIISLAHSLRLTVTAEGVETEEQAKLLRLVSCDEMQGYLFSKPLPEDQLFALLRGA